MISFTGNCELGPDTGTFALEVDCRDGDADARRLLDLLTEIVAKGLMGPHNVLEVPLKK